MSSPCQALGRAARRLACLTALLLCCTPAVARAQIGGCTPDLSDAFVLEVETNLGTIPIELYPNLAPATVRNFVRYAATHSYDGVLIHRSVPGFVIQGGGYREQNGSYVGISTFSTLPNEACLSNAIGTVAMARLSGQPNSATSQWFVNLADNTGLDTFDGGFTAFGRVVGSGMAVANAIAALPRFDALAYLTLPYNQILSDLPLQSTPLDPPEGYGCSRASPTFGLVNSTFTFFIADPLRSSSGVGVPILLDPQCTGSGSPPPPVVSCTPAIGRDVLGFDLDLQDDFGSFLHMSCAAVSESEISWAARRTGTISQLFPQDVEILAVPEPDVWIQRAAGLAALALLQRARRPLAQSRAASGTGPR